MRLPLALVLVALSAAATPGPAVRGSLRKPWQVDREVAKETLVEEVFGNMSKVRLAELEGALRTTCASLPKEAGGRLGHQGVRYALHRLFLQQRGWFIKGLEPTGESSPPPYLQKEWVPSFLQEFLEQRFGEHGLELHELAALAVTLEDLVKKEVSGRLEAVFRSTGLATDGPIGDAEVENAVALYMAMYLTNSDFSRLTPQVADRLMPAFELKYPKADEVSRWWQAILRRHRLGDPGRLDFAATARIAEDLGERFGEFNDLDCQGVKKELTSFEDKQRPGRVRLAEFYRKGMISHWKFEEKPDYLRTLGALDESIPGQPFVIIPNYVAARGNCLEASAIYAVCCRNECEDLMGHLEREIAAPAAEPERIARLVSALPSATVAAPRDLPASLRRHLDEAAAHHNGQVPLHGRLFAQWMHHAFPRECPYPHEAGSINPQTPGEWMGATGANDTQVSEEEMQAYVANQREWLKEELGGDDEVDLPWTASEELPLITNREPSQPWGARPGFSLNFQDVAIFVFEIGLLAALVWAAQRYGVAAKATAKLAEFRGSDEMAWSTAGARLP